MKTIMRSNNTTLRNNVIFAKTAALFVWLCVAIIAFLFSAEVVFAQETYTLLEPLPNIGGSVDISPQGFGEYINNMIKLVIGLATVLAVVMVVYGGLQYMTSAAAGSKQKAKTTITHALAGLLLALSAFIILNTINPRLTELTGIPLTTGEFSTQFIDPESIDQNDWCYDNNQDGTQCFGTPAECEFSREQALQDGDTSDGECFPQLVFSWNVHPESEIYSTAQDWEFCEQVGELLSCGCSTDESGGNLCGITDQESCETFRDSQLKNDDGKYWTGITVTSDCDNSSFSAPGEGSGAVGIGWFFCKDLVSVDIAGGSTQDCQGSIPTYEQCKVQQEQAEDDARTGEDVTSCQYQDTNGGGVAAIACDSCKNFAELGLGDRMKPNQCQWLTYDSQEEPDSVDFWPSSDTEACRVNAGFGEKLKDVKNARGDDWRITEAWPPTVKHADPCHQVGTCVDVGFKAGATGDTIYTPDKINDFIQTASAEGLGVVFETPDQSFCRDVAAVVGEENVHFLPSINANHFSVYDDTSKGGGGCD